MTNLKIQDKEKNSGELCLPCFDNLTFQYHGMTEIYNNEINRYVGGIVENKIITCCSCNEILLYRRLNEREEGSGKWIAVHLLL